MSKIPYDITFHPSWWHQNADICFDEAFFYDAEYRLASDVAMRRMLHEKYGQFGLGEANPQKRPILWTDLLASGFLFSAMCGCDIAFAKDAPPQVLCANRPLEKAAECSAVRALQSPWWQETLAQAEKLKSEYGHVISCINLQGVQNLALDICGEELFLGYHDKPGLAHMLLASCCDLLMQAAQTLQQYSPEISGGVTSIVKQVFPEGFVHSDCTADMISADCFAEFLLPYELRLAQAFPQYGVHHCGASMERQAANYAKIPGLAFAEVGAGSNVPEVCRHFPQNVHLSLRVSPVMLKSASPEEIRGSISKLAADCDRRENLSISCVGIDADTPDESIVSLLEAMQNL